MSMKEVIFKTLETFFTILGGIFLWAFASGLVQVVKNLADNKTKKICDLCFRDIKRWHNEIEKNKKENAHPL